MALTPAQLVILHDYIVAEPDLASQPIGPGGTTEIQRRLNLLATPTTTATVWEPRMSLEELALSFEPSELSVVTPQNRERLQTLALYMAGGIQPDHPHVRDFFLDIFPAATAPITRAAILARWRRLSTRTERLLAVGVGSTPDPATMTFSGDVSYEDVDTARRLP